MNITDHIDYARAFAANVQGQLYARFRPDPYGNPEMEMKDGVSHYTLDIHLHSPRADKIEEVEYVLDDPTYTEPIRRSTDRANDFPAEVWSYGDVPIIARVKIGDQVYEQRAWLSNLLENGHTAKMTPAIRMAIQRIKVN